MKRHWDDFLDVRSLVEEHAPGLILELGAGSAQNTHNLLGATDHVWVITDGVMPVNLEHEVVGGRLTWVNGISYLKIGEIPHAVPFCVLDTDHNGWTLNAEFCALETVMPVGAVLCIHDTMAFHGHNGYAMDYGCGAPYHQGILDSTLIYGEVARTRPGWELIREVEESCGAMALIRTG